MTEGNWKEKNHEHLSHGNRSGTRQKRSVAGLISALTITSPAELWVREDGTINTQIFVCEENNHREVYLYAKKLVLQIGFPVIYDVTYQR